MPPVRQYAVAASSRWRAADGVRLPAGDVHAWVPGTNQTVCGLALSRSRLERFPHVPFTGEEREPDDPAEPTSRLCTRCRSVAAPRTARRWVRRLPRP